MKKKTHAIKTETAKQLTGRDYVRELARTRDGHTCKMCGKRWIEGQRRFDIHHIVGCGLKSMEYDRVADMDNLITYCHKCHLNLHSVKLKMKEKNGQQKHAIYKSSYYKKKEQASHNRGKTAHNTPLNR